MKRLFSFRQTNRILSATAVLVFLIGAGCITTQSRPTSPPANESTQIPVSDAGTAQTQAQTKADKFTLAQIEAHNSAQSCWTAINGYVYDLSSWIPRHPGGPQRILALCGTDATRAFTNQHGNSRAAQAALALLKIGSLN